MTCVKAGIPETCTQQATLTYPLCSSCSLPYPPCDWEPQDLVVVAAVQEELVPASSSSVDQPVSWVRSRKHKEGWEGLVRLYEVIHVCNTPFRSRLCVTWPWKECCVTLTVQVCFSPAGRRGLEYLMWSWGGRVMLFSSLASHAVQTVPIFFLRHFWRILWVKKNDPLSFLKYQR